MNKSTPEQMVRWHTQINGKRISVALKVETARILLGLQERWLEDQVKVQAIK